VNLTKTLAVEWARDGVRVNAVAPGVVDSSGLDTYPEHFRAALRTAHTHNYAHRLATESEVAAAVVFLLSPASAYTSAATLRVDAAESRFSPLWPPLPHGWLHCCCGVLAVWRCCVCMSA
jgi:citronellol/citronellal dehydrogenase